MTFGRCILSVGVGLANAAGCCGVLFVARSRWLVSSDDVAGSRTGLGDLGLVLGQLFATDGRRWLNGPWDHWRGDVGVSGGGVNRGLGSRYAAVTE